ncbi:C-type lectin domain family 2 member D-like [Cinclus cinclus]|uniref:C-type lectin domain family 2 member D-like n=1 Tax=Cinclus cinclus TaxID=127875 RepID=UPI002E14CE21
MKVLLNTESFSSSSRVKKKEIFQSEVVVEGLSPEGQRSSRHPVLTLVLLLLLFLLLAVVAALAVRSARQVPALPAAPTLVLGCPSGWVGHNGVCYYFSRDSRTWEQSQEQCSELGASLAIVQDEAMHWLLRLRGNVDYWLGLRRRGERLRWGDGSSFSSSVPVLGSAECVCLAEEKFRTFAVTLFNQHRRSDGGSALLFQC